MNKFKFYFIVLITTFSLFSCSKDDPAPTIDPPADYAEQYKVDTAVIEAYLKTNFITVTDNHGFTNDQDVTISKITAGETSIWDQTIYQLKSREVNLHGVPYKVYYLVLRQGVGQSPSNADAVLASYNGSYLQSSTMVTATQFEESKFPNQFFSLLGTIKGWGEIFPQFKTGNYNEHKENNIPDGTIDYTDFGAGVMFIPSGLAYFQNGPGSIPSYAPLVFSFKLYEIQRLDSDGDGILNYQENLDGNGYMYDYRNSVNYPTFPEDKIRYADDTDKDGIPNFVDVDDDGDGYTTKLESKRPDLTINNLAVSNGYYPFTGASVDNPKTLDIDERQGIPNCSSDFISPTRLRKYLDKSCH